jgi:chromosome partitioning protein
MTLVITLAHQKGGVGKSTLALNLCGYFSKAGQRAVLVDTDPQGSATALLQTVGAGRDNPALIGRAAFADYEDLRAKVGGYDVALVDTPPYLSKELRQAVALSHLVLIPCKPSPLDALAVVQTAALVKEEQALRPSLAAAMVLTMVPPGTGFPAQIRQHLGRHGLPILGVEIANRVAYARSLLFSAGSPADPKAKGEIARLGQEIIDLLDKAL